jgi:hypothetical protein
VVRKLKGIFLFLVIFHGLIHLMGFLDSFKLVEFSQLTLVIPKPIGTLWLISTFLFLITGFFFVFKKKWWVPAIIATIISQYLIIISWQDAKFGTIANIIILIIAVLRYTEWNFNRLTNKELSKLIEGNVFEDVIVTKNMINTLPPQVQRWLINIGMVGKEKIHTVYFKQKGVMKLKPDQKRWFAAAAEQYVSIDKPAFIWKVIIKMIPLINVVGRDIFKDGKGQMVIKIASLIPVVKVSNNEKVDQSSLQRYLLELPWYPSAALSSYITWESLDEYSVKANMRYNGISGSALFHFNEKGDLEKVSAFRFKDSDNNAKQIECIGEIKENVIIDGIKIPTKFNVSWMLEEGKFTWYKLEIYDIHFN